MEMESEQENTIELRLAALEASMRQVELESSRFPANASLRMGALLDKCAVWLSAESDQQKQIDDAGTLQHERFEFLKGQIKCFKRNLDTLAKRAGLDPDMEGFYDNL